MNGELWPRVLGTLQAEFSDLADPEAWVRVTLRLLLAALLGGLVGYEREQHRQAAGLRTHILVAVGAALFVLVPKEAGMTTGDLSRVIQGVVAGIGFLGAGAILKSERQARVKGLTTAAGIWLTAAIGIAAGMGRDMTALVATVLALAVLRPLRRVDEAMQRDRRRRGNDRDEHAK